MKKSHIETDFIFAAVATLEQSRGKWDRQGATAFEVSKHLRLNNGITLTPYEVYNILQDLVKANKLQIRKSGHTSAVEYWLVEPINKEQTCFAGSINTEQTIMFRHQGHDCYSEYASANDFVI